MFGNIKKVVVKVVSTILMLIIFQGLILPYSKLQAETSELPQLKLSGSTADDAVTSTPSYSKYLMDNIGRPINPKAKEIEISLDSYLKTESIDITSEDVYEGYTGIVLTTTEQSILTFPIYVFHPGFYQIEVEYYPIQGNGGKIVRNLLVNGEIPYKEANGLEFSRIWSDETPVGSIRDKIGNDIRPKQVEKPKWTKTLLFDPAGFHSAPLSVYFDKGEHKITLTSRIEPMAIRKITLKLGEDISLYTDIKKQWDTEFANREPETIIIQGEDASAKSDQTLYPIQDRSSPDVIPYSVDLQRLNTIGGDRWKTAGQWIEWTVNIPENALYTIAMRWKQDTKINGVSIRECWIDGELPFKEASNLQFEYGGGWQVSRFLEELNGNPYEFYLSKGTHTIRLKVGLGEYATIVEQAQNMLYELNRIYRQIVTITGPQPDQFRDYQFDVTIPTTIESMKKVQSDISRMETTMRSMYGKSGQNIAALNRLFFQLKGMTDDIETIAYRLMDFQNSISGFGGWINQIQEQPLEIDYLIIGAAKTSLPRAEAPFYTVVWHYLRQFVSSFTSDYADIGVMEDINQKSITIWIGSGVGTTAGRDQAQLIRQLISESFTPNNKISVKLQLVSMGALLPATLAGIGPDVALQQPQSDPLNFALRNAVIDLTEFSDFKSVESRFYESALEPFRMHDHLYALPETQSYPMMFYRKDILDELGISLDLLDDWDSVLLNVLPKIQKSYLQLGILANINTYAMFLYQENGSFYMDNNQKSGLDSIEGIAAFEKYTSIYTEYRQVLAFDFANRFRTGEMPIAIIDFTAYNQLSVFAPEIKELWGMRPVPGTRQADGSLNRFVASVVSGGIILSNSKNQDEAWNFLKWWTQDDTQTTYGRELESIMGSAARYPTANIIAMEKIPWEKNTKENLKLQQAQIKAVPEIPGGYFTPRHLDFAFRDVVISGKDVRETITKAATNITDEIINKLKEFDLSIN